MTRFRAHNGHITEFAMGAAMPWKVAEAKQKFSDVVRQVAREPQLIFNRERLVAAVIDGDTFRAFQAWREQEGRKTVGFAFGELRHIIEEEDYEFEIPTRQDRTNAFLETIDDLSK